jgi:hypothetical protein
MANSTKPIMRIPQGASRRIERRVRKQAAESESVMPKAVRTPLRLAATESGEEKRDGDAVEPDYANCPPSIAHTGPAPIAHECDWRQDEAAKYHG